jgi:hypothetical protein
MIRSASLLLACASVFVSSSGLAQSDRRQVAQIPPVATAAAQPSYPEGYDDLRAAALIDARQQAAPAPANSLTAQPPDEFVALYPCDWQLDIGATDAREAVLEETARRAAFLVYRLHGSGYPPAMFEGLLRDHENQMLALAARVRPGPRGDALAQFRMQVRGADEVLVTNFEARRRRGHPEMRPLFLADPCIASGRPSRYRLVTRPANGRAWVVSNFAYYVCQRRAPDPWDVAACPGWREVHGDEVGAFSGRHKVQARWPDGRVNRSERTFEPYDVEQVVNLSPTG